MRRVLYEYKDLYSSDIFNLLISDYLLVCRFVPVLVLPRYSVATGSISPPSQYGRTVLWNSHVKTKIKRYLELLEDWTVIRLIFKCPGTLSSHCLQQKLLPEGITPPPGPWGEKVLVENAAVHVDMGKVVGVLRATHKIEDQINHLEDGKIFFF